MSPPRSLYHVEVCGTPDVLKFSDVCSADIYMWWPDRVEFRRGVRHAYLIRKFNRALAASYHLFSPNSVRLFPPVSPTKRVAEHTFASKNKALKQASLAKEAGMEVRVTEYELRPVGRIPVL